MKKFFLIPLLTLVCSVMAWADVTTAADLQTALNSGGTITLGADILNAGELEIPSSVPALANIDLNGHKLSGNITNNSTSKNMQMRNGEFNGTITTKGNVQLYGGANNLSGDIVCKGGAASKYFYVNDDQIGVVTANITTDGDYALFLNLNKYEGSSIIAKKGTVNISNCSSTHSLTISVSAGVTANVNANASIPSGSITNAGTMTFRGTIASEVSVTNSGTLNIASGTCLGAISNTGTVNITGGTISNSLISYVNTESYSVADNGDGTSTISLISIRNTTQDKVYGNDLTIALNEANAGDEISFLQAVNIPAGKTLDMPNVTITHNNKLLTVNGTLNIGEGVSLSLSTLTVGATGTLNMDGGTLAMAGTLTVQGAFNMSDGILNSNPATAANHGVSLSGASATAHSSFDFSGGTINYSGTGRALSVGLGTGNSASGHLNITGGTINTTDASSTALYVYPIYGSEEANISNLTVNAEGKVLDIPTSSASGHTEVLNITSCNFTGKKTNPTGASPIGIINNNMYYRININGGTYTNATGAVVVNANSTGGTYLLSGTFIGEVEYGSTYKKNNSIVYGAANTKRIYISSGTRFSQNPTNYIYYNGIPANTDVGAFVPAGCTAQLIAGKYEVVAPTSNKFVEINGVEYTSIESLMSLTSWSQTNNTVRLLQDYTWNMDEARYIPAGYNLTLDLDGHTLTVRGNGSSAAFSARGTLTIDGTDEGSKLITYGPSIRAAHNGKVIVNGGTYESYSTYPIFWCDTRYDEDNKTAATIELNNINALADMNTVVQSGSKSILNINGGTLRSNASTKHGRYAYAVIAGGTTTIDDNPTIIGVQGGLSITGANANAIIRNGDFSTVECAYGGASHYALYVAYGAQASVYGGNFKSYNASFPAVLSGNEDIEDVMGVVFLYGGQYSKKAKVQMAEGSTFPASVPPTSTWYASFGDEAPLPAGYEYYATGNATYPWGVRRIEGTETAEVVVPTVEPGDPEPTIPWQQNTTWDPNADPTADGIVPEESTIVTIPVGATVVVSNAQEDIEAGGAEAVAEQVFVNQGATLKVETGTTLNVGDGGVNIANGGQIIVEPGAIVTIGTAGMITTEDEALVIEATEEDQGVFLLQPEVTENTQPKATVKLVTKCKQVAAGEYIWERIAIPTIDGEQTTFSIEGGTADITTYDGGVFQQGLYGWSDAQQDWVGLDRFKDMKPFKGYQLSNNSLNAGVTYVFEGNLVGNTDQAYQFAQSGFGFFGNSYTGDIDIMKFFETFGENMQKTIWIYDYYTDGFKAITADNYGTIYYGTRKARHGAITDIRSMQAFLMNTFAEGESQTSVDYSAAIWGNPKYGLVPNNNNNAPAKRVAKNEDRFTVYVAGQKQEDEVSFIRSNEYSSAFDNGADASKWMNNGINLYVATDNGEMAVVASDEVADMTIAFRSGNETEYTLGFDNLYGETFELRDVITSATILMVEGATYTFTQEPNTTIPARFQIVGAHKMPTGMDNTEDGANVQQKVMKNGTLYILRDNKWYSAQGQLVK